MVCPSSQKLNQCQANGLSALDDANLRADEMFANICNEPQLLWNENVRALVS